jgi:hypothetical protein
VEWVNPHQISNWPAGILPGGYSYVWAIADAYALAERGEGDWPPPIVCHSHEGEIVRADGNHRMRAALISRVRTMPIYLFPSMDALSYALDRSQRHAELEVHVRAARLSLAREANGSARLSATERESFRATVARADADREILARGRK